MLIHTTLGACAIFCVAAFCRNQGAILSIVVPETLLDYRDYMQWISKVGNKHLEFKDEEQFNCMSNQAWTCVIMQIVKVMRVLDIYSPTQSQNLSAALIVKLGASCH